MREKEGLQNTDSLPRPADLPVIPQGERGATEATEATEAKIAAAPAAAAGRAERPRLQGAQRADYASWKERLIIYMKRCDPASYDALRALCRKLRITRFEALEKYGDPLGWRNELWQADLKAPRRGRRRGYPGIVGGGETLSVRVPVEFVDWLRTEAVREGRAVGQQLLWLVERGVGKRAWEKSTALVDS